MHRTSRILAVVLLVLAGTLVNAAPAAAVPRLIKHVCKQVGEYAGYEGVHCADLYREGSMVWAGNQIICQTTSGKVVVACSGIKEQPVLQVNSTLYRGVYGTCGVSYGHSPCRAERIINYSPRVSACDALAYGGTIRTVIKLPSDVEVGSSSTQLWTSEYGVGC